MKRGLKKLRRSFLSNYRGPARLVVVVVLNYVCRIAIYPRKQQSEPNTTRRAQMTVPGRFEESKDSGLIKFDTRDAFVAGRTPRNALVSSRQHPHP